MEELAESINSTKATLSRYENGKRVPDIEFIANVANFFGVSADYLLGRSDNPNEAESETANVKFLDAEKGKEYDVVVRYAKDKGVTAEQLERVIKTLIDLKESNDK